MSHQRSCLDTITQGIWPVEPHTDGLLDSLLKKICETEILPMSLLCNWLQASSWLYFGHLQKGSSDQLNIINRRHHVFKEISGHNRADVDLSPHNPIVSRSSVCGVYCCHWLKLSEMILGVRWGWIGAITGMIVYFLSKDDVAEIIRLLHALTHWFLRFRGLFCPPTKLEQGGIEIHKNGTLEIGYA